MEDGKPHFLSQTASRREALRARLGTAADRVAERRAIATTLGTDDEDLTQRIQQLGLSGDSARALDLLPLVHVCWADGRVQKEERATVLAILEARGVARDSDAYVLIESLLEQRPSETFLAETLALLKDLAARTGTRPADVVELCAKVAAASGGLLGLGARTSDAERALIERVAAALGEAALARFQALLGAES